MESGAIISKESILLVGSILMLSLAFFIILFIFLFQRKLLKKKEAFEKIESILKKQELNSAYELLESQDRERQRIAEELHDDLGSALVTINMYTDTLLKGSLNYEQEALSRKIKALIQITNDKVRKIAHGLDTGILNHFGLEAALKDLALAINESSILKVELDIDLPHGIVKNLRKNIYRISQELLNNALKHSKASNVNIEIAQIKNEYISYIYQDNGIGLPSDWINQKGMGLRSIFSRIESMNGTYTIDNSNHKGLSLIIEVPL
uniref:sensor histidine kinase n=1 Tax=Fulvivirga sp. TaxID=1931237 RepID=UPI0040498AD9